MSATIFTGKPGSRSIEAVNVQSPADLQRKIYRGFKTQLTRALNKRDWRKVIEVADAFNCYYSDPAHPPFPDDWSRWQRAKDDAQYQLKRQQAGLA